MKKIGRIFGVALLCLILFSCSNLLEILEHDAIPLHTVSYESEWGTAPTSVEVLDNTALTQEHLPLLLEVGYTFEGWYCEDTKIEVGYILHDSITLTAKWQENTLGIKVQAPSYSDIPNLATPTISGTTVTFVAPEEYASYSWYIDGVLQDNEHTQSFILDTTNLSARSYYIMLVVVDEKDAVYSAQYELEVTK